MEHTDADLRVSLLIRPERGTVLYPVSLRASWLSGSAVRIMTSPQESWHAIARRMEEIRFIDNRCLGYLDAHIGRGEPVSCSVVSTLQELHQLGLCEVDDAAATAVTQSSPLFVVLAASFKALLSRLQKVDALWGRLFVRI